VSRCKRLGRALDKLSSPNLEKALTFLDDKLLPATSNAVERSNRRYRKAQKSIYSVRTAEHIRQRIALDMQRDQQAPDRAQTTKALHQARSGTKKTPRMMLQSRKKTDLNQAKQSEIAASARDPRPGQRGSRVADQVALISTPS